MELVDSVEIVGIDNLSATKRQNVQQIQDINSCCQQIISSSSGQQIGTEQMAGHDPGGQRLTLQNHVNNEEPCVRAQKDSSSVISADEKLKQLDLGSRTNIGTVMLETADSLRNSGVSSPPIRERLSRNERPPTPVGKTEINRSSVTETVGNSAPYRSRTDQTDVHSNCVEQTRTFSIQHGADSPRQRISLSSEHQRVLHSETGPPNSSQKSENKRAVQVPEGLPPSPPLRPERQKVIHLSEQLQLSCPYQCGYSSSVMDNDVNLAISSENQNQQDPAQSPQAAVRLKLLNHNIGVSVTTFSKPKLIRLRSEPCAFNTARSDALACWHPSGRPSGTSRRRREELKRSLSFEVTSPSFYEALWTGVSLPSQLIITRPQMRRAKVNRKHLSLHLEGSLDL